MAAVAFAQRPPVLENEFVRVLKVTSEPHQKGRMHDHKVNRVMIYLTPGTQRLEYQGGKPVELKWKASQALWSPASGMHTSEITSDKAVTIVEIELKKPGNGAKIATKLDPVKVDPKHYKVEMENDHVRVIRFQNEPHGRIPLHEHTLDRVQVFLTPIANRATTADGKSTELRKEAGEVGWGTPVTHHEENLADAPIELLVVELKK